MSWIFSLLRRGQAGVRTVKKRKRMVRVAGQDGAGLEGFVSTQSVSRVMIQGNRWKERGRAAATGRGTQPKSSGGVNKW
jgi:hypothetical protein